MLDERAGLAQTNLGSITGIITDPQGAIVPEAPVTATNVATGLRTSTKSNSTGIYLLTSLSLGTYTVTVEHPGFSKYVREGITVDAGQRLGLDIELSGRYFDREREVPLSAKACDAALAGRLWRQAQELAQLEE